MMMIVNLLPHFGVSLLVGVICMLLTKRYSGNANAALIVFATSMVLTWIPLPHYSLTHYLRPIFGDLSITTMIWLATIVIEVVLSRRLVTLESRHWSLAAVVVTAIVLYPTALGLTRFDLYQHGYYPIILAPAVLVLFGYCILSRVWYPAGLLAAAFAAYTFGLLESDNLWDYLLDPVLLFYAGTVLIRERRVLTIKWPGQAQIERFLLIAAASFLVFAVFLSRNNPDSFRYEFVIEDGFIEWCTVVMLVAAMLVCGRRFLRLRKIRPPLFLTVTVLLTFLCLFGAGEEISWGQRIFGIETPEYLMDRNAQGELGLHNMVIEVNGEEVKLNKLIFGTGLAICLFIYLFVATPLYRTKPAVRSFFDRLAAPMPRNYQIIGYLAVVATVELLVDSSKRGEMTEFAGSIIFALNVIYPYNPEIFAPEQQRDL